MSDNTNRRTPAAGDDLGPVLARLREIAAATGDALLLADGPPHPDAKLLDICAEVAEAHRQERATWEAFRRTFGCLPAGAAHEEYKEAHRAAHYRLAHKLRAASKLSASTGAGIFAKALAIRASRTGTGHLAKSLAEDLLGNAALRACLWTAEGTQPPT